MSTTIIVLSIAVAVLIIYDIWAVLSRGLEATISWVIWSNSQRFPLIPLLVGILMGHLFWKQETPPSELVKCSEVTKP